MEEQRWEAQQLRERQRQVEMEEHAAGLVVERETVERAGGKRVATRAVSK